jgi:hypothetical protein
MKVGRRPRGSQLTRRERLGKVGNPSLVTAQRLGSVSGHTEVIKVSLYDPFPVLSNPRMGVKEMYFNRVVGGFYSR